jgi:hypothetical protein
MTIGEVRGKTSEKHQFMAIFVTASGAADSNRPNSDTADALSANWR